MNLFGQFTVRYPSPTRLQIYRDPGLLFWLFMLVYFGFLTVLSALFVAMYFDLEAPSRLTCRASQTSQTSQINCNYVTSGPLSGKTVQIQDLRSAIASQRPNGETIVLTSSSPWVALQPTDANSRNIEQINRAIAQLRQGQNPTFELELRPPAGAGLGVVLLFGSVGLLFWLLGLGLLLTYCSACFELDAEGNQVTITRLGWRIRPARFMQLLGADRKPFGYLGWPSDKLGIYGGDSTDRISGRETVRLLFASRRPLALTLTWRHGEAEKLVACINAFIEDRSQPCH